MTDERPTVSELWERWWASGAKEDRDRLVVAYAPLVRYVAERRAGGGDVAEGIRLGLPALVDAIGAHRPDAPMKAETLIIARAKEALISAGA